jgi:hypothetical protein
VLLESSLSRPVSFAAKFSSPEWKLSPPSLPSPGPVPKRGMRPWMWRVCTLHTPLVLVKPPLSARHCWSPSAMHLNGSRQPHCVLCSVRAPRLPRDERLLLTISTFSTLHPPATGYCGPHTHWIGSRPQEIAVDFGDFEGDKTRKIGIAKSTGARQELGSPTSQAEALALSIPSWALVSWGSSCNFVF